MRIQWRKQAEAHASGILEYIARDNITAAYRVYEAIHQKVLLLADYPKLGRLGRVKGTRELVINRTPYIAAYRIKGDAVQILAVLHGAQQWPKRLP